MKYPLMLEEFSIFVAHPTKRTMLNAIKSLAGHNGTRARCDYLFPGCVGCPFLLAEPHNTAEYVPQGFPTSHTTLCQAAVVCQTVNNQSFEADVMPRFVQKSFEFVAAMQAKEG